MESGFKNKIVYVLNSEDLDLSSLEVGTDWTAKKVSEPAEIDRASLRENQAIILVCCANKKKLLNLFSTFELRASNLPTMFLLSEEDPEVVKLCYQSDFIHLFMKTEKQLLLKAHIAYTFQNYELIVKNNSQKWLRHIDPGSFTKKEYQILEFIARAPMTELSREELQQLIWGQGKNTTNKLDVHICNLRKKLNNKKVLLQTYERGKVALAFAGQSHFYKEIGF